jgi:hypothetical protein
MKFIKFFENYKKNLILEAAGPLQGDTSYVENGETIYGNRKNLSSGFDPYEYKVIKTTDGTRWQFRKKPTKDNPQDIPWTNFSDKKYCETFSVLDSRFPKARPEADKKKDLDSCNLTKTTQDDKKAGEEQKKQEDGKKDTPVQSNSDINYLVALSALIKIYSFKDNFTVNNQPLLQVSNGEGLVNDDEVSAICRIMACFNQSWKNLDKDWKKSSKDPKWQLAIKGFPTVGVERKPEFYKGKPDPSKVRMWKNNVPEYLGTNFNLFSQQLQKLMSVTADRDDVYIFVVPESIKKMAKFDGRSKYEVVVDLGPQNGFKTPEKLTIKLGTFTGGFGYSFSSDNGTSPDF